MSPTRSSSTWFLPFSSTADIRTRPAYTYPHSACALSISSDPEQDVHYHSVPMKFSVGAFAKMLLSGSDVFTGRQIRDDLLSDPSSRQESRF